ncbi:MAG: YqhA family protein, partial [Gammaproteobacteria bacterium]|nr:YqhA family protein [Gammaproteobacteria bacterium]
MMKKTEQAFESMMFKSRWLLAPFFFGLLIAIVALLVKFAKELINLLGGIFVNEGQESIISILT